MTNIFSAHAGRIGVALVSSSVIIFCTLATLIALLYPDIFQKNTCMQLSALLLCLQTSSFPLQFLPQRGQPTDASYIATIGIKGAFFFCLIIFAIAAFTLAFLQYTQWAWCMIALSVSGVGLELSLLTIASVFIGGKNK